MYLELGLRILIGGILGGIIGLERKHRFKQAGFKTHFLVGLGSTLIMVVSRYGFLDMPGIVDPTRIAAQVVSGIGFLGAGTIMVNRENVTGLTTAAGLWVTAAIGLAIGNGMYVLAVLSTALVVVGLEIFSFESVLSKDKMIEVQIMSKKNIFPQMARETYFKRIKITSFQCKLIENGTMTYELKITTKVKGKIDIAEIIQYFSNVDGVESVKVNMY
ncbi:MAG: MgtC/SapB family protein [Cellulosilyticaceae bacterium]